MVKNWSSLKLRSTVDQLAFFQYSLARLILRIDWLVRTRIISGKEADRLTSSLV